MKLTLKEFEHLAGQKVAMHREDWDRVYMEQLGQILHLNDSIEDHKATINSLNKKIVELESGRKGRDAS